MTANTINPRMKKLAAGLSVAIALIGVQAHAFASVRTVISCADDNNSRGTLRQTVAKAVNGDQIDLSRLSCPNHTINLTQGELVVAHEVTLYGAAGYGLTITSSVGRVLRSTSKRLALGNLTISGGAVHTGSDDAEGGCILAAGKVFLTGSVVSACTASSTSASARGGAVSAQNVILVNSRISGNAAISTGYYQVARGGGVYAQSLSCTDSTLSGNSVVGDASNGYGQGGGALIASGDLNLSRCTVDTNVAGQGGGIMQFVFGGYTPKTSIENSTISGNAATFTSAGVEVFCIDCTPQPVHILNSTLVFNSSPTSYGDGLATNGTVDAQSSIIAMNGSADDSPVADLFTTQLTGADNLIMGTNARARPGVIVATSDPQLMPLSYNGGLTQTHSMLASSPAMHVGNNTAAFSTDQRGNGFSRSDNGMVDIGAFQWCQPSTTIKLPAPKH